MWPFLFRAYLEGTRDAPSAALIRERLRDWEDASIASSDRNEAVRR